MRPLFLCLVLGLGISAHSQSFADAPAHSGKVNASAVWQMPAQFITSAHGACDKSAPSNLAECFMGQLSKAGASAQAVKFTRELYKQSKGDVGIMTGFQPVGPVDIAWITYPLRANTNNGLLFVNGQPEIINVEDLKLLDTKSMRASGQFQDLLVQFPKADVWPGDRDGKTWPNSQAGPNGGTQFIVAYPLLNGCHACARAGVALFTWNFTAQGKFLGTTFIGMTPPPLQ
ncbi:MAG TPA: hypothetical protein VLW84_03240 [Terriglobales bacterium]|nr:hypothetical protein [Terriglobales bacterium]